jgi:hypothetical protein
VVLDDDDWLLPGALNTFCELASQKNESVWLYGGIRIVDESGETLAEMNSGLQGNCFAQIMGGAWAPIQASLIRTETFFQGVDSTHSFVGQKMRIYAGGLPI